MYYLHTEILSLMAVVVVSQGKKSGFAFWNKEFEICKTIWKNKNTTRYPLVLPPQAGQ